MFPITLDLATLPVLLTGNGPKTTRRLVLLDEAGARNITVYADQPETALVHQAGNRLINRLPEEADITAAVVVMIVDLPETKAASLATIGRKAGRLVNVEDDKRYCDFYFPSTLRRGDLTIAVSTNGKSPTLARRIKELLAHAFTEIWAERITLLGNKRLAWKAEANSISEEVMEKTDALIKEQGWFGDTLCPHHRIGRK